MRPASVGHYGGGFNQFQLSNMLMNHRRENSACKKSEPELLITKFKPPNQKQSVLKQQSAMFTIVAPKSRTKTVKQRGFMTQQQ